MPCPASAAGLAIAIALAASRSHTPLVVKSVQPALPHLVVPSFVHSVLRSAQFAPPPPPPLVSPRGHILTPANPPLCAMQAVDASLPLRPPVASLPPSC